MDNNLKTIAAWLPALFLAFELQAQSNISGEVRVDVNAAISTHQSQDCNGCGQ